MQCLKSFTVVVKFSIFFLTFSQTVVDKEERTPLQLCKESRQNDWEMCVELITEAVQKEVR